MIFLKSFCYSIVLMALLNTPFAFSARQCWSVFFTKPFWQKKIEAEDSNLLLKERVKRAIYDVLGVSYPLSLASRNIIKEKGLQAIEELPASERALIDFGAHIYKNSFIGAITDSVLGLITDPQLHQIPAENFRWGYIVHLQKTVPRLTGKQFDVLVDTSNPSALMDLPSSFIKENRWRLSPGQITRFPQIKEATTKEFQALRLHEDQILAYIRKNGLSEEIRQAIPEGPLREKVEMANRSLLDAQELELKRKEHIENLLRTGSGEFRMLKEKEDQHWAGYGEVERLPIGEKVSLIERMSLEEIKFLSEKMKNALVRKEDVRAPVPLFMVNYQQHSEKVNYLLAFLIPENISSADVSLRKEIFEHLTSEDKSRLSNAHLNILTSGVVVN